MITFSYEYLLVFVIFSYYIKSMLTSDDISASGTDDILRSFDKSMPSTSFDIVFLIILR